MVRPLALRLSRPEAELLDEWVARTDGELSASDVMRVALVASGLEAVGRDRWASIASAHHLLEEWDARLDSLPVRTPWHELDRRIARAPGDDEDRDKLRESIRTAIAEMIDDHETAHSCPNCGEAFGSKSLKKSTACSKCGVSLLQETNPAQEEIPF